MLAPLLAVLLSLPAASADRETHAERAARMATTARAIERACSDWPGVVCRALLVTIGVHESHFAEHVHAGRCKPYECDRGRAQTPWQLQRYSGPVGVDLQATTAAATEAARRLRMAYRYCKRSVRGAISVYATGARCEWRHADKRLKTFEQIAARLTAG